jgi:hypothetical protein
MQRVLGECSRITAHRCGLESPLDTRYSVPSEIAGLGHGDGNESSLEIPIWPPYRWASIDPKDGGLPQIEEAMAGLPQADEHRVALSPPGGRAPGSFEQAAILGGTTVERICIIRCNGTISQVAMRYTTGTTMC